MAHTLSSHGPHRRLGAMGSTLTQTFWVLALGVVLAYAFFLALGAIDPGDVGWLSATVGALLLLFVVRAVIVRRRSDGHQDPEVVRARERRGF